MTTMLPQSSSSLSQSTLVSSPPSKYRYSAIDDLQLPPALSVTPSIPLSSALTMALEREYSQLTVISPERRKLLGYLDVPLVLEQLEKRPQKKAPHEEKEREKADGQEAQETQGPGEELLVKDVYTRFDRRKSVGYTVITPDTSLDVLEEFLKHQKFAIGIPLYLVSRTSRSSPPSLSPSLSPCLNFTSLAWRFVRRFCRVRRFD